MILKTDGTLWACGSNNYGQLGDRTHNDHLTPVQVMTDVSAVSAGEYHTMILKTDGSLWACGYNYYGQLGDGTTTDRRNPKQIMTGVSAVSAGHWHTMVLKTDGTLWACGRNFYGQLGDGTTTDRSTPVQVMTGVSAVAAGGYHTMILKTDGSLWACGQNSDGQLGDGTTINRSTPVLIAQKGNTAEPTAQTLAFTTIPAMTYGDAAYTLPATTAENLALTWTSGNTSVATISGNTLTIKGAGAATITATQAGNDSYLPFSREFTLTVNKAMLTITANDCTKQQGEANPALTVSYSGFKYNDTAASLTKQPTVTTTATTNSPVGTYPITPSGAASSNYEFTYVSGTLTVTAADTPPGITVTDISQMANVIYIEPTEAMVGNELTLSIKMKNTAPIRGFQFDLYLPEGVTAVKTANGKIKASLTAARLPEDDAHTLTVSQQQDGAIRFLCGSQYDENFTGNDGEIATVKLNVAEDMAEGDYPLVLRNVKLTETDINNYYTTDEVIAKLTVFDYVTGDISGDGIVDVSDYIGVANHIMGNTPQGFNAKAADVNADNAIDVSDYIGVANIIMTGSANGQSAAASRSNMRKTNTDVSGIANVIYVTPFSTPSNTQMQLSLKMKNTAPIRGFQFDLYLPEGVTAAKTANGRFMATLNASRLPEGDEHTLTVSEQQDGAIRFLCGSQYDENFTGNDGEIISLTVNIAENMEAGDYAITLKDVKLTETDINNYYLTEEVVSTMTVTGAADNRIVLNETSTTAPAASDGAVDVRVMRTIYANEWSTICLPFAMTAEQIASAFGSEVTVELGDFKGYTVTEDVNEDVVGITINFDEATAIEANHPYIIKVSAPVTQFTVDGVTIAPSDNPRVSFGTNKKPKDFIGTFVADYDFYNAAKYTPLFLSGNKIYYATENTQHIMAFRAFFDFVDELSDIGSSASRVTMSFNDEATGITEHNAHLDGTGSDRTYTLQGLPVSTPRKGLYIREGKKVIIK